MTICIGVLQMMLPRLLSSSCLCMESPLHRFVYDFIFHIPSSFQNKSCYVWSYSLALFTHDSASPFVMLVYHHCLVGDSWNRKPWSRKDWKERRSRPTSSLCLQGLLRDESGEHHWWETTLCASGLENREFTHTFLFLSVLPAGKSVSTAYGQMMTTMTIMSHTLAPPRRNQKGQQMTTMMEAN